MPVEAGGSAVGAAPGGHAALCGAGEVADGTGVRKPPGFATRAAAYVVLADRQSERRRMAGLAHEPPPRRTVWPLRCPHEAESGEVRELVTECRLQQPSLFCEKGREYDAARGSIGATERPGESVGEPDRDRGGKLRHRPEPGKLADTMVEAAGKKCLQ